MNGIPRFFSFNSSPRSNLTIVSMDTFGQYSKLSHAPAGPPGAGSDIERGTRTHTQMLRKISVANYEFRLIILTLR